MQVPKQTAPFTSLPVGRCLSRRKCTGEPSQSIVSALFLFFARSSPPTSTLHLFTGHVLRAADIPEGVAWDPEGLLPPAGSAGGHFARRAASRQATPATTAERPAGQPQALQQLSDEFALPAPITSEPALRYAEGCMCRGASLLVKHLNHGDPNCHPEVGCMCRSACESALRAFMPLDFDAPGLTALHLDPPIFTVDHLLSNEECQSLIDAAEATGGAFVAVHALVAAALACLPARSGSGCDVGSRPAPGVSGGSGQRGGGGSERDDHPPHQPVHAAPGGRPGSAPAAGPASKPPPAAGQGTSSTR